MLGEEQGREGVLLDGVTDTANESDAASSHFHGAEGDTLVMNNVRSNVNNVVLVGERSGGQGGREERDKEPKR